MKAELRLKKLSTAKFVNGIQLSTEQFEHLIWNIWLTDCRTNIETDRHTQTDWLRDGRAEWRLTDRCLTNRQTDGMTDWRTDRQTDRRTNRQIDGLTDGQTDRQTDRQTDWLTDPPLSLEYYFLQTSRNGTWLLHEAVSHQHRLAHWLQLHYLKGAWLYSRVSYPLLAGEESADDCYEGWHQNEGEPAIKTYELLTKPRVKSLWDKNLSETQSRKKEKQQNPPILIEQA